VGIDDRHLPSGSFCSLKTIWSNHYLEVVSVELMEPPEDGKVNFAKELYGESLQISKLSEDSLLS
jgi:hypothetical protein